MSNETENAPRLNSSGKPRPVMPEGQKYIRCTEIYANAVLKYGSPERDAPPATADYNGHGHFVCESCNNTLNDQFDDDYA